MGNHTLVDSDVVGRHSCRESNIVRVVEFHHLDLGCDFLERDVGHSSADFSRIEVTRVDSCE
jgi:hypothetical protein